MVLGPEEAGYAVGPHVWSETRVGVRVAVAEVGFPAREGVVEGVFEVDAGLAADLLVEVAGEGRGGLVGYGGLPADDADVFEALEDVFREAQGLAGVQEAEFEAVADLQHLHEVFERRRLGDVTLDL